MSRYCTSVGQFTLLWREPFYIANESKRKMFGLLPRLLSFKPGVQVWNTYALLDKVIDEEMLALLTSRQIGNRAARIGPRAVKRLSMIDDTQSRS
jgi:hypothetical protein